MQKHTKVKCAVPINSCSAHAYHPPSKLPDLTQWQSSSSSFSNINFDHHRSCHHHHHHHRLITFSIHLVCVHSTSLYFFVSFSLCICVCLRANSSSSPLVLPPDISTSAYLKYSFLPHQSVSISLRFLSTVSVKKMARPLCPVVSACERGCPPRKMAATKVVTTRKSGDHKDHHPRHHHLQWSLSSADDQDISKLSPPLSSLSSSSPSSPSSPSSSVAHLDQLTRRLRPHFFFLSLLLLTSTVVVQCKYTVFVSGMFLKINRESVFLSILLCHVMSCFVNWW